MSYLLFAHIKCDATEFLLKRATFYRILHMCIYARMRMDIFLRSESLLNSYIREGTCLILIEDHFEDHQIDDCFVVL